MPIDQFPYNVVAIGAVAVGGILILLRRYFNGGRSMAVSVTQSDYWMAGLSLLQVLILE